MRIARFVRPVVSGLCLISACAALAQAPKLAVFRLIAPGAWQLHEVGTAGTGRSLCARDLGLLLQVRHGAAACSRFVVADDPRTATISYSCRGAGSGRTVLRVESESIVRIQTQGIANGSPFDVDYEARRTGGC